MKKRLKKSKLLVLVAALCLMLPLRTVVSAQTGDRYLLDENGNWFAQGGINKYDEVETQSREETRLLEENLIADGYVLCNTANKMISEADYNAFIEYRIPFWFTDYMRDFTFFNEYYRVYIYKPSFDDFIEQLQTSDEKSYTKEEINASTVVINYKVWEDKELYHTVSDEYNDNIPEWYSTGYMEIRSPVDCEVRFLYSEANRYYVFYVSKNIPFKVKVRQGCYHLIEINNRDIPDNINNSGEDTLPYNNQIQIRNNCTIDEPYIIELYELVDKYNVPSIDISGKPDLSIDQNQNIPEASSEIDNDVELDEESTVIEDKDSAAASGGFDWSGIIIAGAITVLLVVIIIAYEYIELKKKEREDNDEE